MEAVLFEHNISYLSLNKTLENDLYYANLQKQQVDTDDNNLYNRYYFSCSGEESFCIGPSSKVNILSMTMSSSTNSIAWIGVQSITTNNFPHTSTSSATTSIRDTSFLHRTSFTPKSTPRRPRFTPSLCQQNQQNQQQQTASSTSNSSSLPEPSSKRDNAFVPGIASQLPFYLAIVAAQSVPFIFPSSGFAGDFTYFTTTAVASIIIGCRRAVFEPPNLSAPISRSQAFAAPFAASTFLFGAYLLLKYTDINVALLFNVITTFAGSLCLKEALDPVFQSLLTLPGWERTVLWSPKSKDDTKNKNESSSISNPNEPPTITLTSVLSTITSLAVTAAYLNNVQPVFVFSNLIAVAICTRVLSIVRPASFTVAAGLLCGLFFYDIFWVFGSEVMVSVATQIDSPGKLLFPRDMADLASGQYKYPYAILGLGDVCVPGIFISIAQALDTVLVNGKNDENDLQNNSWGSQSPYFTAAIGAYFLGLVSCFGVNFQTHAAQPALLYLVPSLIFSAIAVGASRGELKEVFKFQSEQPNKENT